MKEIVFTDRVEDIDVESAFEVVAKVNAMKNADAGRERLGGAPGAEIINFHVGQPDFKTPENIKQKGHEAIDLDKTAYTPPLGEDETRDAAAEYISQKTGVPTKLENVVITSGSKFILDLAIQALVKDGEGVVIPDPGYAPYEALIKKNRAEPVRVPIRADNGFRLDVRALEACLKSNRHARMLVINSPANPTGGVLEQADCEAIAQLAQRYDLYVVTDEIYSELIYDGAYASVYQQPGMTERTIFMDGCSKAWSMCGWRLGFGAMPKVIADKMGALMVTPSCAPSISQWAAIEAFTGENSKKAVAGFRKELRERRNVLVEGLNGLENVTCASPQGAFYVFADFTETDWPDQDLADALLQEQRVATVAGSTFGEYGTGYLRFSFAQPVEKITIGVERIGSFLQSRMPSVDTARAASRALS